MSSILLYLFWKFVFLQLILAKEILFLNIGNTGSLHFSQASTLLMLSVFANCDEYTTRCITLWKSEETRTLEDFVPSVSAQTTVNSYLQHSFVTKFERSRNKYTTQEVQATC